MSGTELGALGASVGASHCPHDNIMGSTPVVSAIHRDVAYAPSALVKFDFVNMSKGGFWEA